MKIWKSVPHNPTAATRTSTSCESGSGVGISATCKLLAPFRTQARIVLKDICTGTESGKNGCHPEETVDALSHVELSNWSRSDIAFAFRSDTRVPAQVQLVMCSSRRR